MVTELSCVTSSAPSSAWRPVVRSTASSSDSPGQITWVKPRSPRSCPLRAMTTLVLHSRYALYVNVFRYYFVLSELFVVCGIVIGSIRR